MASTAAEPAVTGGTVGSELPGQTTNAMPATGRRGQAQLHHRCAGNHPLGEMADWLRIAARAQPTLATHRDRRQRRLHAGHRRAPRLTRRRRTGGAARRSARAAAAAGAAGTALAVSSISTSTALAVATLRCRALGRSRFSITARIGVQRAAMAAMRCASNSATRGSPGRRHGISGTIRPSSRSRARSAAGCRSRSKRPAESARPNAYCGCGDAACLGCAVVDAPVAACPGTRIACVSSGSHRSAKWPGVTMSMTCAIPASASVRVPRACRSPTRH